MILHTYLSLHNHAQGEGGVWGITICAIIIDDRRIQLTGHSHGEAVTKETLLSVLFLFTTPSVGKP